jgi:broad specificity phosphatase PhoE
MNHLYFVRHGENLANITKQFSYKIVDYPLTPKGVLQSEQTAQYFIDKNIHEIYTSPLKRAAETAEIIGRRVGVAPVVVENFREVNVGDLEILPISTATWIIHNTVLDDWTAGKLVSRFPNGEDYAELWSRLRAGLVEVTSGKQDRNIIVVAHGAILTFPIRDLCPQADPESLHNEHSHNCSVMEVLVETVGDRVTGQLLHFWSADHLSGEAANFVSGFPQPGDLGSDGQPIFA